MSPASPAVDAVRSPDAVEEAISFEFTETPDVAATAPAPTLRKSRRVVFILTPPIPPIAEIASTRKSGNKTDSITAQVLQPEFPIWLTFSGILCLSCPRNNEICHQGRAQIRRAGPSER